MHRRSYISDEQIRATLEECKGIRGAAAHKLGVSPRTLSRWIKAQPDLTRTKKQELAWRDLQVLAALYHRATTGDDVRAMIFWLQTFSTGWVPVKRPVRPKRVQLKVRDPFDVTLVTE